VASIISAENKSLYRPVDHNLHAGARARLLAAGEVDGAAAATAVAGSFLAFRIRLEADLRGRGSIAGLLRTAVGARSP
jgi:hypothetical protein